MVDIKDTDITIDIIFLGGNLQRSPNRFSKPVRAPFIHYSPFTFHHLLPQLLFKSF